MKKKTTWTKFRHWLIKKLGGYATPIGTIEVSTYHRDVLTLESSIAVHHPRVRSFDDATPNIKWFEDAYPVDMMCLKDCMANKIMEMGDEAIEVTQSYDPVLDTVIIRGRIRIAANK